MPDGKPSGHWPSRQQASNPWPFNINAAGMVFGMGYVAFFGANIRSAAIGITICMLWCTSQICQTLRDDLTKQQK